MKFVDPELKPYLKLSLAFHAGLFIIFGVKVLFFPDLSDMDDTPTIKVDLVALPDKDDNRAVPKPLKVVEPEKKPEEKLADQAIPPKPQDKPSVPAKTEDLVAEKPKAETKVSEEKADVATEDESDAFAKLRELEALKKIATTEDPNEANNAGAIKGNRLAPGDSLEGVNKLQYNNYKKVLQEAVKSKWDLPPWLQDGNLSAEALIKIDATGMVTEQQLITPSGNSIYDKYVMDTITKSSPFPPPPDKFVDIVAAKGVVLSFN